VRRWRHDLGCGPAKVVGWSDGAAIGILVARLRPDPVGKVVYIGQNLTMDGLRLGVLGEARRDKRRAPDTVVVG
jgi:pimeloyl-ACP methyl ester carboxylesterase